MRTEKIIISCDTTVALKREVIEENKYNVINYAKIENLQNIINLIKKYGKIAVYFENKCIHFSFGQEEYVFNVSNDLFSMELNENVFFEKFSKKKLDIFLSM